MMMPYTYPIDHPTRSEAAKEDAITDFWARTPTQVETLGADELWDDGLGRQLILGEDSVLIGEADHIGEVWDEMCRDYWRR